MLSEKTVRSIADNLRNTLLHYEDEIEKLEAKEKSIKETLTKARLIYKSRVKASKDLVESYPTLEADELFNLEHKVAHIKWEQ